VTDERAPVPLVGEDDATAGGTSLVGAAAAAGVFALAFLATCALVGAGLPLPRGSRLSTKLEHFAEHADEYDVVFLGSSKVYRHVDPALFDELTPERGPERRSFNMGVSGMAAIEIHFTVRELLARRPARLRWVLVDPHTLGLDLLDQNMLTGRVTNWHDLESTWMASRFIVGTPRPWLGETGRLELLGEHWLCFAYHVGNVGRARLGSARLPAGTLVRPAAERARAAGQSHATVAGAAGGARTARSSWSVAELATRRRLTAMVVSWLRASKTAPWPPARSEPA